MYLNFKRILVLGSYLWFWEILRTTAERSRKSSGNHCSVLVFSCSFPSSFFFSQWEPIAFNILLLAFFFCRVLQKVLPKHMLVQTLFFLLYPSPWKKILHILNSCLEKGIPMCSSSSLWNTRSLELFLTSFIYPKCFGKNTISNDFHFLTIKWRQWLIVVGLMEGAAEGC